VTDFEEWMRQPQLAEWLQQNFALISDAPDYLLYDLNQPAL